MGEKGKRPQSASFFCSISISKKGDVGLEAAGLLFHSISCPSLLLQSRRGKKGGARDSRLVAYLLRGEVKELVEVNATVGELAEGALLALGTVVGHVCRREVKGEKRQRERNGKRELVTEMIC